MYINSYIYIYLHLHFVYICIYVLYCIDIDIDNTETRKQVHTTYVFGALIPGQTIQASMQIVHDIAKGCP